MVNGRADALAGLEVSAGHPADLLLRDGRLTPGLPMPTAPPPGT